MKKTLLVSALSIAVGLALGALLFRGGGGDNDHAGHEHPAAPADGGAMEAETWTCAMHPQVKLPQPGKCPICAMNLTPLGSPGGTDGERRFSMSEAAKKLAGIATTKVVRGHPQAEVRMFGKVMYDETKVRTVAARFPGRIDRLYVDYTGIRVKAGDHLATVYSPELLSVQTELLTAKKFGNDKAAQITRDKLRLWGFSDKRIAAIEASGETLDHLTIDAPSSGIVTHKSVNEGDYVVTGSPYFKIADLDEVWVILDAYESDTPWLRFGQNVQFSTESMPGKTFDGKISFISPELDPATRTVSVRVNVPNVGGVLKPGMFVSGLVKAKVAGAGQVIDPSLAGKWISPMHPEIVKDQPGKCDVCGMDLVKAEELGYVASGDRTKPPLLIPASAVLHTGKRSVVYVETPGAEEPTFEGRVITIGPRAGDQYIVEDGLEEGEMVVSQGGFVIDSALQIQAKNSMMLPGDEDELLLQKLSVPAEFLTSSDDLLQAYFAVQQALVADSLEGARAAASDGLEKLNAMPVDSLAEASATVWKDIAERFEHAASEIADAEEIAGARLAFQQLTAAAEDLVRRFGTAKTAIYQAYCPMAFDNQGADWLQADRTIGNPYFGSAMLKCGEIKEQLASVPAAKPAD